MATLTYTYHKYLILFIFAYALFACQPASKEEVKESAIHETDIEDGLTEEEKFALGFDIKTYLVDFEPDSAESLELRVNCAIFISPDEQQAEEMRLRFGSEDFHQIVEDNLILELMAMEMLNSAKACNTSTRKRYIVFINPANEKIVIDTKAEHSLKWNLILFHVNKEPKIMDIPELELEEVIEYFDLRSRS